MSGVGFLGAAAFMAVWGMTIGYGLGQNERIEEDRKRRAFEREREREREREQAWEQEERKRRERERERRERERERRERDERKQRAEENMKKKEEEEKKEKERREQTKYEYHPSIKRDEITDMTHIYSGPMSTVLKASWRGTTAVAFKILRNAAIHDNVIVKRELDVLSQLRHPRLVFLFGICHDLSPTEGIVALVMEFMEHGSLFRCLHEPTFDVNVRLQLLGSPGLTAKRLQFALEVAEGMRFLHAKNVIHRDLKSPNVVVDSGGHCKITDFGLSAFRKENVSHVTLVAGTEAWTAPEVLLAEKNKIMRSSADVYGFGVVLWELWSDQVPWAGTNHIVREIMKGKRLPLSEAPGIVSRCLGEWMERPNFDEICTELQSQLTAARIAEDIKAENCFFCPITLSLMVDPVIAADGHSYERTAIEDWMRRSGENFHSPMTNELLPNRDLLPNFALKNAIKVFRSNAM